MVIEPFGRSKEDRGIINGVCYYDGPFVHVLCDRYMTLTPEPDCVEGAKIKPNEKFIKTEIKKDKAGKPIGFTITLSREPNSLFEGVELYILMYTQYIPKSGPKEVYDFGSVNVNTTIDFLPANHPHMINPTLTLFYWGKDKSGKRKRVQVTFWIETMDNKK